MEILSACCDILAIKASFQAVDSDRVRAIALAMGMVPVIWTRTPAAGQFDTDGTSCYGG
jgi:hypothetical protein